MQPIRCTQATLDYAHQLIEASDRIMREMGLNGGEATQGAAIFAGITAKQNAKPGQEAIVAALSAAIVSRLGAGGSPVVIH